MESAGSIQWYLSIVRQQLLLYVNLLGIVRNINFALLLIFSAEIKPLTSGRSVLMFRGFSFSNPRRLANVFCWRCSCRTATRCKVYIHVDRYLRVIKSGNEHNHNPPNYDIAKSGISLTWNKRSRRKN